MEKKTRTLVNKLKIKSLGRMQYLQAKYYSIASVICIYVFIWMLGAVVIEQYIPLFIGL
jgi:hypothetical protein